MAADGRGFALRRCVCAAPPGGFKALRQYPCAAVAIAVDPPIWKWIWKWHDYKVHRCCAGTCVVRFGWRRHVCLTSCCNSTSVAAPESLPRASGGAPPAAAGSPQAQDQRVRAGACRCSSRLQTLSGEELEVSPTTPTAYPTSPAAAGAVLVVPPLPPRTRAAVPNGSNGSTRSRVRVRPTGPCNQRRSQHGHYIAAAALGLNGHPQFRQCSPAAAAREQEATGPLVRSAAARAAASTIKSSLARTNLC
jgi:hypothetical protein